MCFIALITEFLVVSSGFDILLDSFDVLSSFPSSVLWLSQSFTLTLLSCRFLLQEGYPHGE